ncbi:substrate-binding domain-containing protein [Fodinicola feengrottensis]|uniref:substrate-binding domain-containing protein n=1 Tax=Fodinicola feengrottensis TaxID=435914 RepID=UPI0024436FC9|nr:substrate-binding domain-containing protein [Fodinicola feengrottensis]
MARSSGGPRVGTDPSGNAVYDQFALDAVSFATFGSAPLNLTLTQIRSIYNCNVTDWSAIAGSGKTGTIHRYLPQAGSGTRSFFIATILGGTFAPNSATCPLDESLQENDATGVAAANQSTALMAYSAGQWVYQNVGEFHAVDKTAGNWIGTIAGVAPATGDGATATINASAVKDGSFVGSRGLFFVTDNRLGANFTAAQRVVGLNQTGVSPLCNGDVSSVITDLGFVPLDQQEDGTFCVETVVS